MICDFIGVSRIAQSTEFDYNNTKLNEFYADIISKMHMNKDILVKILELTGNGRLKHIKLESQSLPDDMLNMYGHQIITNCCLSSKKQFVNNVHERYYIDNFISFYIIIEKYLIESKRLSALERPQRFFSFLEPMYYGFCDLLWKYILSFGKLEESELRKLPRGGVNPIRSNLDMIFGIRGLLYTGDAFYDSVNISVFALRCYIESWIRETFDIIISVDGNYIPIGIAINCIKKCSEKNSTSDKFNKYMISISKINDWSNFYIHWKVKPVFWTPHFVFMYLQKFSLECRDQILKDTGIEHVTPPMTHKNSEFYNLVRNEINLHLTN